METTNINQFTKEFLESLEKSIKKKEKITIKIDSKPRAGMSTCAICPKNETFINKRRIPIKGD